MLSESNVQQELGRWGIQFGDTHGLLNVGFAEAYCSIGFAFLGKNIFFLIVLKSFTNKLYILMKENIDVYEKIYWGIEKFKA